MNDAETLNQLATTVERLTRLEREFESLPARKKQLADRAERERIRKEEAERYEQERIEREQLEAALARGTVRLNHTHLVTADGDLIECVEGHSPVTTAFKLLKNAITGKGPQFRWPSDGRFGPPAKDGPAALEQLRALVLAEREAKKPLDDEVANLPEERQKRSWEERQRNEANEAVVREANLQAKITNIEI